jgi:LCP family protein required for cell wall assembly
MIGRHGAGEPDRDPQLRTPPASSGSAGPAGSGDPEHTQIFDASRPEPTRPLQESSSVPPPPPSADQPKSFGGTYDAPPRKADSGARFATPADAGQPPPGQRPPGGPATKTKAKPPKRPGKRRNWWVRGVVALVLVWVLFLVVVPIWAWSKINKVDASPDGNRPADTAGTTYLLVGSDSRADLSKAQKSDLGTGGAAGQRTDTILMLHIPDGGGPNLLLSIPRDSYVDIPGHGKNKINAAYAFGGAKLLVQTVEANTDIKIDDYIEIGFTGFVDIVDAVGGIQVCPKEAINDPKAGHLKMRRGCQEVDGHTALSYSRSRAFSNGDITRTEHQRGVITEVGKKAASWSTIVLPWRYFKVNKAGAESLTIGDDVGPFDLAKFAWAMAHSGSQKRCVVPFSSLSFTTPDGQSAVLWDDQRSAALFSSIREDDTSGAQCNATGQP